LISCSGIDDLTVLTHHLIEDIVTVHEVIGRDIEARGDDATDIDHGGGGEKDPVGVDQDHLAVGVDATGNGGTVITQDSVEGDRRGSGLDILDTLVLVDVIGLPVDGHVLAGLVDGRIQPGLIDRTGPAHHLAASRRRLHVDRGG